MIIVVEGNIGAGKSVLCQKLYSELSVCGKQVEYFEEPLDLWTNMNGENILELFYKNKNRWAFTFQVNALFTMHNNSLRAKELSEEGKIVIMERSVFSSTEIFAKVLSDNVFRPVETVAFNNCKSSLPKDFEMYRNKTLIYIKTDPNTCLERINKRSRSEEIGKVSIDYINQLHDTYEENILNQDGYEQTFQIDGSSSKTPLSTNKSDDFNCLLNEVLATFK